MFRTSNLKRLWRGLILGLALVGPLVAQAAEHSGKRYALLIGIDGYYNGLSKLKYCGADMTALRDELLKAGFEQDRIVLMTDDSPLPEHRPSKVNIEKQFQLLAGMSEPNDLVLLAFSGHGAFLDHACYWCPPEADLANPAKTLISVPEVYGQLERCKASMRLVLVDACRDDPRVGRTKSSVPAPVSDEFLRALQRTPDSILLLNSCSLQQQSLQDDKLRHGVFSYFLIQGLQGAADANQDGNLTLGELWDYAADKTKTHVSAEFKVLQVPRFTGDFTLDTQRFPLRVTGTSAARPIPPFGPAPSNPKPTGPDPFELLSKAETLAQGLTLPGSRSVTLAAIGYVRKRAGDLGARRAFEQAIYHARQVSDNDARAKLLLQIARMQHEAGDWEGAKATSQLAFDAAESCRSAVVAERAAWFLTISGSHSKDAFLKEAGNQANLLINASAQSSRADLIAKAVQLAPALLVDGLAAADSKTVATPDVTLVLNLVAKDRQELKEFLSGPDPEPRESVVQARCMTLNQLRKLVLNALRTGEPLDRAAMKRLLEAARAIPQTARQAEVLAVIGWAERRFGDRMASRLAFEESLALAVGLEGIEKDRVLMSIVHACAHGGDIAKGVEISQLINDSGLRSVSLVNVTYAAARQSPSQRTLSLLRDLLATATTDAHLKAHTLAVLTVQLALLGQPGEGSKAFLGSLQDGCSVNVFKRQVREMGAKGAAGAAIEIADRCLDDATRAEVYAKVAQGILEGRGIIKSDDSE